MTIDYPACHQIPQLRKLWKAAFGDSDLFLDAFFEHGFSPRRCRCITRDGAVVSALYWFEATCRQQRFAYLYAVAVRKDCRSKGYGRKLLEYAHSQLAFRGYDAVMLYPGEESLRNYYDNLGYTTCTTVSRFTCTAAEIPVSLQRIDRDTYARLRRTYLPDTGVIQEGENIDFLENYVFFYSGEDFLLAASAENGKLYCPELLGNADAAPGVLKALHCKEGSFQTPGKDIPFAMMLPLRHGVQIPDYLGLVFD